MQVKLDDTVVYEITDTDLLLLKNEQSSAILIADIQRRLNWVITHKLDELWKGFQKEWLEKLSQDPSVNSIPCKKEDFIRFVVSRSDYLDRDARDAISIKELR